MNQCFWPSLTKKVMAWNSLGLSLRVCLQKNCILSHPFPRIPWSQNPIIQQGGSLYWLYQSLGKSRTKIVLQECVATFFIYCSRKVGFTWTMLKNDEYWRQHMGQHSQDVYCVKNWSYYRVVFLTGYIKIWLRLVIFQLGSSKAFFSRTINKKGCNTLLKYYFNPGLTQTLIYPVQRTTL